MSKKTIYYIVGIYLILSYYFCSSSGFLGHPPACSHDGQGNYTNKKCSIWRNLGLIKCKYNVSTEPVLSPA